MLAAGTVLFNQPFHDNTVDGSAGSVSLPATPTKTNVACLSAAGNATANPLASCTTATDPQGSGKLRLTSSGTGLEGGVFASTSVPTSQGLDVTFNSYQYGGSFGADGIAFVLAAVDPANPATPSVIGQSGGALGYSAQNSTLSGLSHGYLGVGIDAYGNFSNKFEGTGCTDPANISQRMPGQVVVRGPGNGTVGYCALQSSAATATSPALTLRATTRAASTGTGRGGLQPEFVVGDDTVRAGRAGRRLRRHVHPGGRHGQEPGRRAAGGARPGFTRRAGSARTGSPSSWRSAGWRPPAPSPTTTRSTTRW